MHIDMGLVPADQVHQNDVILFSESAGRFIVTIDPDKREIFEKIFKGLACACIGTVTSGGNLKIKGIDNKTLIEVPVQDLKDAWKQPFGDLI